MNTYTVYHPVSKTTTDKIQRRQRPPELAGNTFFRNKKTTKQWLRNNDYDVNEFDIIESIIDKTEKYIIINDNEEIIDENVEFE